MIFWAKYGVQTTFMFPMVKRGVVDLAVSGDWTPAAADSAISKDLGNWADTTNTVAVAAGGAPTRSIAAWKITLSATELQAARIHVQIVDAATKAVEDQMLVIYTYGHANAMFAGDWSDIIRLGLTALPNAAAEAAGGLYTRGAGAGQINQPGNGRIDVNVVRVAETVQSAGDLKALLDAIDDFVDTEVAAIKAKTDNLPPDPADASDIAASLTTIISYIDTEIAAILAAVDTEVAAIKAKTDNLPPDPADASDIMTSLGTLISYVDTEVAAILAAVDTEVAAIKAKTDNLPAAPAAVGDIPTAVQNVDAFLDRNMATGVDSGTETIRTPRQALRMLRNKVDLVLGKVKKEDDATDSHTFATTTDPLAEPITVFNPTGGA